MSLSNLLKSGKLIIIKTHISGTQLSLHRQLKQTAKKIKYSQNIFTYTFSFILTIDNQYIKKINAFIILFTVCFS